MDPVARKRLVSGVTRIATRNGVAGKFETPPHLSLWAADPSVSDARFLGALQRAVKTYHSHSRLIFHAPLDPATAHAIHASRRRRIVNRKPPGLAWDARTRIGRVTLFTHWKLPGEPWDNRPEEHVACAHRALERWQAAGMRGLIVDLRSHHGGSFRPGLHALGGLLLRGSPLMRWVSRPTDSGSGTWKVDTLVSYDGDKELHSASNQTRSPPTVPRLPRSHGPLPLPVALVIGPGTSSSGEILAACLHGKPRVRSFGAPTGGALSVNEGFKVAPLIELMLTTRLVCTMDGVCHTDQRLVPDQRSKDPLADAEAWLLRC
jgi:hypothetical protein